MIQRKKLRAVLIVEAICCILLGIFQQYLPKAVPSVASFPFSQLGLGLRALSLSGSAGNIAAIVLYALLCLLPALSLLPLRKNGPLHPEDSLLGILSLSMFPVLWLMVNPGHLAVPGSEGAYCMILWSLAVSWLVLRMIRSLFSSDRAQLLRWFSRVLVFLALYNVFEICAVHFPALLKTLSAMQAEASPYGQAYTDTEFHFTVLQAVVTALPSVLCTILVFRTLELLDALQEDREDLPMLADRVARFSGMILTVTVVSTTALNVLQLFLQEYLRNISVHVVVPVFSLILVLGVLLLCRMLAENKHLRDDNNLFI